MDKHARALAVMLRLKLGPDVQGIGPDAAQLAEMWNDEDPSALRPAINALERMGFIRVSKRLATPDPKAPAVLGIDDIAGISITERLQEHFDDLGL